MPSPEHLVHGAFVAVHGVHHDVQRRVQELAGLFGIEALDQLGRALEVGKEHRDLLALAFQGGAGRENFLGQIGRRVGEWRFCRVSDGRGGAVGQRLGCPARPGCVPCSSAARLGPR